MYAAPGGKIGLLLERIAEFGETARRGQVEGVAGTESAAKEYTKSAHEKNSEVNSKLAAKGEGKLLGSTLPTKEGADGNRQTAAVVTQRWPINCLGYTDLRGPRWVREALAKHMEQRQFKHEVDPDRLCIGAGITSVLRSGKCQESSFFHWRVASVSYSCDPAPRGVHKGMLPTRDSITSAPREESIRRMPNNAAFVGVVNPWPRVKTQTSVEAGTSPAHPVE